MSITETYTPTPSGGRAGGSSINVSTPERALSVAGGALLALDGLRRRDLGGVVEALLGAALVQRGVTGHCQVYGALGISTAEGAGNAAHTPAKRMLHVHQAFTIRRTPQELYGFWRALENLPSFMEHLESVTVLDERRSHWVASAPLGREVEWDAEITEDVPNERIAWHSVEGSEVANAGSVSFRDLGGDRGTEVHVSLEYAPPGGEVGATIAKLFGENPEQQVKDDLRHFKQIMEAGEVPTITGQPSGRR